MGCVHVSGVLQTNGRTPLFAASENGHVEVVRALVGAGAAVNQAAVRDDCGCCWCSAVRVLLFRTLRASVQLCMHVCACGVRAALGSGRVRGGGEGMQRMPSHRGSSCWAGRVDVYDCVREVLWAMIVGCARVSGVWQTDGYTPLYIASQHGHVEVVRALVGAGAAVNQAWVRDDCGGSWCSMVWDCWFWDESAFVRMLWVASKVLPFFLLAGLCDF